MRLDRASCHELLVRSERGVLATRHATRGADAVPVCFAVEGTLLGVPIDGVKPKASVELQRTRNLDAEPRATLLCDHWDADDWSRLWWVRASLVRVDGAPVERSTLESSLRLKYRQYHDHGFPGLLVFRIGEVTGWTARPDDGAAP
jgi:hypothetical protein